MKITVEIEIDDEYADESDSTGLTEEGFELLHDAIGSVGVIVSGPHVY